MSSWDQIGKLLLVLGIGLAVLGGLIVLGARLLGDVRLPGNIYIERRGVSCTIPLLGSIVISLLLTILLNLIVRFLRR